MTTTETEHSVVLRIVVYGPASAGKTTTARALGEGFGRTVTTPVEDEDGATVYFDWMEHVGGRYEGRPILTQVLTVPGHDRSRRLALLRAADVVIYVADTSPAGMIESLALWEELDAELARLGTDPGIVIQANKRDHPAAVSLPTFRSWMALGADQTVIETVASNGDGVRQTYVFAVRAGLERIGRDASRASVVPLDPDLVMADLSTVASEATPDRTSITDAPVPAPPRRRASDLSPVPPHAEPTSAPDETVTPDERHSRRDRHSFVAQLATAATPPPPAPDAVRLAPPSDALTDLPSAEAPAGIFDRLLRGLRG